MDLRYLSFYLLILGSLLADGNSKTISLDPNNKRISVNIDKIFDQLLPTIQKTIRQNGMDPLQLASFSENVVPLPGKLKGNINFRNGFLHYMSDLRRTQHVTAQYSHKRLVLDMTLGWRLLDFSYEYDFTHLLIKRRGDVFGRFEDADFNVIIEIDLNDYEAILHRIHAVRVDKFSLKLYGNKFDPVLNTIAQGVTRVFKDRLVAIIENESLRIFEPAVDLMNKLIKKPNRKKNFIASF